MVARSEGLLAYIILITIKKLQKINYSTHTRNGVAALDLSSVALAARGTGNSRSRSESRESQDEGSGETSEHVD